MIHKIVVVEDDKDLLEYIMELFKDRGGYNVIGFQAGTQATAYLKKEKPSLVTLDLNLLDIRGENVLKSIREMYSDLPVIIITGEQGVDTLVNNFNLGANDYLTKPFNAEELLARVNSKLITTKNGTHSNVLKAKDLTLNLETYGVELNNKDIKLTSKEFELLKYLLINKNRVCTREKILFSVWGYNSEVDTRVVDVFMGKLRKKLAASQNKGSVLIESVWGYGYKIQD